MSDVFSQQISSVIEHIRRVRHHDMTAVIHCSKINSLFNGFGALCDRESLQRPVKAGTSSDFAVTIASLHSSIDRFTQISVQCAPESCTHVLLMISTKEVFEELLEIRQKTIGDLKVIGLEAAASCFTATPDELLRQDQLDLKRIGSMLLRYREDEAFVRRVTVRDQINIRLRSLERKGIRLDASLRESIELLEIPSLPPSLNLVMQHERLSYKNKVGRGHSAVVYEGKILGSPSVVAIKVFTNEQVTKVEAEALQREIFVMSTLNHPSIVKLVGYTNTAPFCIVSEFIVNGSLASFLRHRSGELTQTDRTLIAVDIARGMQYIHERHIIHRDLKSLNILLDDNKRPKICDFGLVRLKSHDPVTCFAGTLEWMAPEVLMCSPEYSDKIDVFSFGIVLWELLTSQTPYNDVPALELPYRVVQEQLRPVIPTSTPDDLTQLLTKCWAADPTERPTFSAILDLLNEGKCHFPNTNEKELYSRLRGGHFSAECGGRSGSEHHLTSRLSLPVDYGATLIEQLRAGVESENTVSVTEALSNIEMMHKGTVLERSSTDAIGEMVSIINEANDGMKYIVMRTLDTMLELESVRIRFYKVNGMQMVDAMLISVDDQVAHLALTIYDKCMRKKSITTAGVKGLLAFSSVSDQRVRETAVRCLLRVLAARFEEFVKMPYFLYRLLFFALKPLNDSLFGSLVKNAYEFISRVDKLPDSIVAPIIGLQTHTNAVGRAHVIQCLVATVRFESVRAIFPESFWDTAAADFKSYQPVYRAFLGRRPVQFKGMIISLRNVASEQAEALDLLVEFTTDVECAKVVVTRLPIQNRGSPGGLFRLYTNLAAIPDAGQYVTHEREFYVVCNLVLSSHFQRDACRLVRSVGHDAELLRSSGLPQHLTLLINEVAEPNTLWYLMAVVFTVTENQFFPCFGHLLPKLKMLLNTSGRTRTGAFLCMEKFCQYCSDINKEQLLEIAAELVVSENAPVQKACLSFLSKEVAAGSVDPATAERIGLALAENAQDSNELVTQFRDLLTQISLPRTCKT